MRHGSLVVGALLGVGLCLVAQSYRPAAAQTRPAVPDEIRARRFVIVDRHSRAQAEFGVTTSAAGVPMVGIRIADPGQGTLELGILTKPLRGGGGGPMLLLTRPKVSDGATFLAPTEVVVSLPIPAGEKPTGRNAITLEGTARELRGLRMGLARMKASATQPAVRPIRVIEPPAKAKWKPCSYCSGTGHGSMCSFCNGTGISTRKTPGGTWRYMCPHCHGRGFSPCWRCSGTGLEK